MNQDLIQKLMISKKIMDKHNSIPRSNSNTTTMNYQNPTPQVEDYQPIQANYNIPQEFLSENVSTKKIQPSGNLNKDMVLNSKLPDEIKRLMLEHPIHQPQQPSVTLSEDVIEAASRLMNTKPNGDPIVDQQKRKSTQQQPQSVSNIQLNGNLDIKKMVKEAVKEILQESGLLVESSQKSNDIFSFRVGQHIFEGKVTKIKKIK